MEDDIDEQLTDPEPTLPLDPDAPIAEASRDRYARVPLARVVATYIQHARPGTSLVYGLQGAWGSGKTSVLKLVEAELWGSGHEVMWFNPWYFAGTEQIATHFLRGLAHHLRAVRNGRLSQIGAQIEAYAETVLDVTGVLGSLVPATTPVGAIAAFAKHAGKALARRAPTGLREQKAVIEAALSKQTEKVVVFLDDIDRLETSEMREVFKLVRLVADFPNVVYVLAYDRVRVEAALATNEGPGREYLAKIVQATFEIPRLRPGTLTRELEAGLGELVKGRTHLPLHRGPWQSILDSVLAPLVQTPRDLRRLLNSVGPAVELLQDEVALEDIVALEAMRLFLSDAFDRLPSVRGILAEPMGPHVGGATKEKEAAQLADFLKIEPAHSGALRDLVRALFPATRFVLGGHGHLDLAAARRDRRVAAPAVLAIYLEKGIASDQVPHRTIRDLIAGFEDVQYVDHVLRKFDYNRLSDVAARLSDSIEALAVGEVVNGLGALVRAVDRFPPAGGMLDGAESGLYRMALFSLRRFQTAEECESFVQQLAAATVTLSRRFWVLGIAAEQDHRRAFVGAGFRESFEEDLRERIRAASANEMLHEPDLLRLFLFGQKRLGSDAMDPEFNSPDFFVHLLVAAGGWVETSGRDGYQRHPVVNWRMLLPLFGGDENALRAALAAVVDRRDLDHGPAVDVLREARALLDGTLAVPAEGERPRSSAESQRSGPGAVFGA